MILETISGLLQLAQLPKLSREQKKQRVEMFRDLKQTGFKNEEILPFAGGLTIGRVKQITKGVAILETKKKNEFFNTIAQLINSNQTIEDVKIFNEEKKKLDRRDESIESLTKLSDDIERKGTDIYSLQRFIDEMGDLTFPQLKEYHDTYLKLKSRGWEAKDYDLAAMIMHNFPQQDILRFLMLYDEYSQEKDILRDLKNEANKVQILIDMKKTELKSIEVDKNYLKKLYEMTEVLVTKYGMSLDAFITLNSVASKFGDAMNVIEAVNKYNSITEVNTELETKKKGLDSMNREIEKAKVAIDKIIREIAESNILIGEIRSHFQATKTINNIINMASSSVDTHLDLNEFNKASYFALFAISNYIEHHGELPSNYQTTLRSLESILKDFESKLK